ncbi:hypothetical protein OIU35_31745 [Boseaceae bacterium BT-24-1]|nr:hypothetical protein [Boseaceae bacterium BT-24-1]
MGRLRSFLVGGVSGAASLVAHAAGCVLAEVRRQHSGRGSTGRSKADRNKMPRAGSSKRRDRRLAAAAAYFRQLRKEREIGVHPKFLHSAQRPWDMQAAGKDWERRSREWDSVNSARG